MFDVQLSILGPSGGLTVRLQFTYPKTGANLLQPLMHKPTNFIVARTSLMSELVLATIKFGMASLEVGPEFAAIF
jgi:hypothetical protein